MIVHKLLKIVTAKHKRQQHTGRQGIRNKGSSGVHKKTRGRMCNTSEVQCSKQMGMRLPYLQGKTSCGMFFQ